MNDRKADRHEIGVMGRYRTGRGVPRDVELLDLSQTGCRFFDRFGRLDVGTEISLRVGSVGPIIATVRWQEERYVGVSFDPPLHEAVLDHMRESNSSD